MPPSDPDEKVRKDNCTVERGQTAKLKKQLTKPQLKENYSQVFIFPNKLRGDDLWWTSIPSKGGRNTPSRFMLQKPGITPAAMSQSAPRLHFFFSQFAKLIDQWHVLGNVMVTISDSLNVLVTFFFVKPFSLSLMHISRLWQSLRHWWVNVELNQFSTSFLLRVLRSHHAIHSTALSCMEGARWLTSNSFPHIFRGYFVFFIAFILDVFFLVLEKCFLVRWACERGREWSAHVLIGVGGWGGFRLKSGHVIPVSLHTVTLSSWV